MNIDPKAKLKIIGLDGVNNNKTVEAQFNPKELQITKAVPWQKQKKSKEAADLEYTGAEPMAMSVELLFDGYEEGKSVVDRLKMVHLLADPEPTLKRPSKVKVIWGTDTSTQDFPGISDQLPEFTGVIESVDTKYTMFASDGTVLRATVNIKFKQARDLAKGVAKKGG